MSSNNGAHVPVIVPFCLTTASHPESLSLCQSPGNMMVTITCVTLRSALRSLRVHFLVQNVFFHPGFQHFHLLKVTLIIL